MRPGAICCIVAAVFALICPGFAGKLPAAETIIPEEGDSAREKGLAAFDRGEMETAYSLFRMHLAGHPGDVEILQKTAYILSKAEEYEDARRYFLQALEAGGENVYSLLGLGNLAFREYDLGEARWYYEQVLAIDPLDRPATENMAALNERIAGVKQLEKLKSRCDLIFLILLSGAALFLAAAVLTEYRLLALWRPRKPGNCSSPR